MKKDIIIDVRILSARTAFPKALLKRAVHKILKSEKVRIAVLCVAFVNDPFIRRLNSKFLSKDRPTDVLAFDYRAGLSFKRVLAADIIISVDAARAAAKELNISLNEELLRYLTHGILHLCGYDDNTAKAKRKMWNRQEKLLKSVEELIKD